ncbi:MAG: ArnT family glycosyltransferase, partial [Owenweeksia sp.]
MNQKKLVFLILSLLAISLFGWLGYIELRAEEPRRAIVSLEMLLSGNWVVPQINGWTYYNKPPVFNWLMIFFFEITGSFSEWVVRLPSLLSFLLLGALHYRYVKKYINREVALLSSLFWLTSADLLFYGSVNSGEIDPFYALVVYLQAIVIFKGFYHKKYLTLFLGSYTLVAVGFLTKGLPSLAFQVFTLLGAALYFRKFRLLFGWQHISGILLLTILCGSYLYLYNQTDDALAFFVRQFKEASQRTGLETPLVDTLLQFFTFPLQLVKLMLPWSLLLVFFFHRNFRQTLFENRFMAFSVIFVGANIWLYWISGDFKARYYYMFLPFVITWFAYFYTRNKELMPRVHKVIFAIFGGLVLIFPLLLLIPAFIPQTAVLPLIGFRVAIMVALGTLVTFVYFKGPSRILAIVLLMVVARLGLNLYYLPALQDDKNVMYYRSAMDELLKITGKEKVYLYGNAYNFPSDASIGPITFEETTLTTAPLIAYQIPYYITRYNRSVVQFTEELLPGRFYIAQLELIKSKAYEPLYYFEDKWRGHK